LSAAIPSIGAPMWPAAMSLEGAFGSRIDRSSGVERPAQEG
jgi:hypothetical protein